MKNKKFSITILLVLSLGIVGILGSVNVMAASSNSVRPLKELALMDLTHENFAIKEAEASEVEPMGSSYSSQPVEIGDPYPFIVSDNGLGFDYPEDFVVVKDGEHIIILITEDAYDSFDGVYHFENPIGDDSEPWLRTEDIITDEQLDYMVDQFDNNIYPTMEEIYGVPNSRPDDGLDPDRNKIWTLLFNIRDEAYYDPDAESYIAGYFSLSDSNSNNKNIMHIDTYAWADRTGPGVARPYLYEGVFAHEYEHMILSDIDPDEPSWVDEGLADLAAFLCGYGHSSGHIAYYFMRHFFTSLTFWGGNLEDYGASYLFQLYLYDHFGGIEFISDLVQEQANGIEGIENTLDAHGYGWIDFDEIFDRWTIANYMDEKPKHKRWGPSKYGYETLDIGSDDTWGYTIEYWILDDNYYFNALFEEAGWGPDMWIFPIYEAPFEVTEDDWPFYFYGYPMPYTAQYFRFTNEKLSKITFDGQDTCDVIPASGVYEWYSDVGAWAWSSISHSFSIPTGDTSLNFKTYYEIEYDWDYSYVEVHDLFTDEWYTLDAPGTVNYTAHPQDNPNTPVGREPITYNATDRWHGFTGNSGGWVPVSMDLTPFAGHNIDLYFTTWQDAAFTLQMMYVDDIEITNDISGTLFFDDVESGEQAWAYSGWYITDGIYPNGWSMNVITTKNVNPDRFPNTNPWKLLGRREMRMDAGTQSGTMWISRTRSTNEVNVAIVSNHADHIIGSSYHFSVEKISWKWKWWHHWC